MCHPCTENEFHEAGAVSFARAKHKIFYHLSSLATSIVVLRLLFQQLTLSVMNNDDEIAVAVLVGMKRGVTSSVITGGRSNAAVKKPKFRLSSGPRPNGAIGKQSRLSTSGVSKSRPLSVRKKTVSKVKVARCIDSEGSSKHEQVGQLNSPVSVTATDHHLLDIRKASSSLLPTLPPDGFSEKCNAFEASVDFNYQLLAKGPMPHASLSQVNRFILPQFASNNDATALHTAVGSLLQEQILALAKQVSPQEMASALLMAEIESLKAQYSSQQQVQSCNLLALPNLVSNLQGHVPSPAKVDEVDKNTMASALIASLLLKSCSNIAF